MKLKTYHLSANFTGFYHINSSLLIWTPYPDYESGQCYTLTLSEEITKHGISDISIWKENSTYLNVYIHQKGSLFTELPGVFQFKFNTDFIKIPIEHEIIKVINYDGEKCNAESDYKLDKCLSHFIHKV